MATPGSHALQVSLRWVFGRSATADAKVREVER